MVAFPSDLCLCRGVPFSSIRRLDEHGEKFWKKRLRAERLSPPGKRSTSYAGTNNVVAMGSEKPFGLTSGMTLNDRWRLWNRFNEGKFGELFNGYSLLSGQIAAIKIEQRTKDKSQQLKSEARVLRALQGGDHVVKFFEFGETVHVNFLVMELVGPNLQEIRAFLPECRFTLATTFRLAVQMIEAVASVHKHGFLHCDVKPANFVLGRVGTPNANRLYLIDFGLSRQYEKSINDTSRLKQVVGKFTGTPLYASVDSHMGLEYTRRDDLWSLFYTIVEMVIGELPWYNVNPKTHNTYRNMKVATDFNRLLGDCSSELYSFYKYLTNLGAHVKPDYEVLCLMFKKRLKAWKVSDSTAFDWDARSRLRYTAFDFL